MGLGRAPRGKCHREVTLPHFGHCRVGPWCQTKPPPSCNQRRPPEPQHRGALGLADPGAIFRRTSHRIPLSQASDTCSHELST